MSDLTQALHDNIKRLLQQDFEADEPLLNTGATDAEFAQLAQLVGVDLPEEVKAIYRVYNGQIYEAPYLFDGEEWLSLERMAEEWAVWKGLLDDGEFADDDGAFDSDAEAGIKPLWWSPLWLPITYDGAGNHLCLDLNPTAAGTYGQVIRMWHDDGERSLEAKSFVAWVAQYVQALEAGRCIYSDEYGAIVNVDDVG